MGRIETLTAYKCKFAYLQRNNPKLEEQRDAIKEGESPDYTFADFIELYKSFTTQVAIGENSDRAIMLESEDVSSSNDQKVRVWHISPKAGKQGRPVMLVKPKTKKKYNFGADSVALYEHQVFVYESSGNLIAIFHRQNGSGCKSVFLETANKALKELGYKLEMELIVPLKEDISGAIPYKITLQYTRKVVSSDDVENIKSLRKTHVIRDLGINLEDAENKGILDIFTNFQLGKIDKDQAFVQMNAEAKDAYNYDDAEVQLKIGKSRKRVKWDELENIMGTHDITQELHAALETSNDFIGELSKLSRQYYDEIIASEEV